MLRRWEERGLLRPERAPATGVRVFPPIEVRMAHVVALLRRGGYPFGTVHTIVDELRTIGGLERVYGEVARRERQVHERSLRRLGASAALYRYVRQYVR